MIPNCKIYLRRLNDDRCLIEFNSTGRGAGHILSIAPPLNGRETRYIFVNRGIPATVIADFNINCGPNNRISTFTTSEENNDE